MILNNLNMKEQKPFVIKNLNKGKVIAHHCLKLLIMQKCVRVYMKIGMQNGSPVDMT